MSTQTVVLFGANGGMGVAVDQLLTAQGYLVVPVTRTQIDFARGNCQAQVDQILSEHQPGIVVNCVGKFGSNNDDLQDIMPINFGSNWNLIRHYMTHTTDHPVRIVMVGSICYNHGRKEYMVYSASKTAMFSLWQGARDYFAGSQITVDLINPQRTRTPMTESRYNPNLPYHTPEEVALEILTMIKAAGPGGCIETAFKN
jgi:ribitol-5-phosphate 2-dehydrogenase (NADP+) / D-ribitol-5-phosphate cytidylyltransferase